jgi:hypothetical protein
VQCELCVASMIRIQKLVSSARVRSLARKAWGRARKTRRKGNRQRETESTPNGCVMQVRPIKT